MTVTDWIQAISTLVLVLVTIIYAWRTHVISTATKQQANASVQIAEETKEQRLTASQPLIFPDFAQARFPNPGEIWYVNSGNGPALKVKIIFAYSTTSDAVKREWQNRKGPSYSQLLAEDPRWTFIMAADRFLYRPDLAELSPGNKGIALVEYSDIYGRRFLAGWGYQCEKDNGQCITLQPTEPLYPTVRERSEEND